MNPNLIRAYRLCEKYPNITAGQLRWWIFNSKNNGLDEIGAIVRPPHSRQVFIDEVLLGEWLESGRDAAA